MHRPCQGVSISHATLPLEAAAAPPGLPPPLEVPVHLGTTAPAT